MSISDLSRRYSDLFSKAKSVFIIVTSHLKSSLLAGKSNANIDIIKWETFAPFVSGQSIKSAASPRSMNRYRPTLEFQRAVNRLPPLPRQRCTPLEFPF